MTSIAATSASDRHALLPCARSSGTVSEAVASAFENQKALPKEGSLVVLREVAGAGFASRYHLPRTHNS